jgi:hypothetical protein
MFSQAEIAQKRKQPIDAVLWDSRGCSHGQVFLWMAQIQPAHDRPVKHDPAEYHSAEDEGDVNNERFGHSSRPARLLFPSQFAINLGVKLARNSAGPIAVAPEVGFEPTTNRLTADRSTAELLRITDGEVG